MGLHQHFKVCSLKDKAQTRENLCKAYLIKDLYPEHVRTLKINNKDANNLILKNDQMASKHIITH